MIYDLFVLFILFSLLILEGFWLHYIILNHRTKQHSWVLGLTTGFCFFIMGLEIVTVVKGLG